MACHPLARDLPLNRLRAVDDIGFRMASKRSPTAFTNSRAARFEIDAFDDNTPKWKQRETRWTLLDELMSEVPGYDNYGADLTDDSWGLTALDVSKPNNTKLNTAYYHRWYKVNRKNGKGAQVRKRAFADPNIFMAQTSQDKVAGMSVNDCQIIDGERVCQKYSQKWSYAIPLEIIYLTPLSSWNPYNIQHKGGPNSRPGRTVTEGGRRNGNSPEKAYNGTNNKLYYRTPAAFTIGDEVGRDPADTAKGVTHVLDKNGNVRKMKASGFRIMTPYIPGIGALRQRYPIMPIHAEGNTVYKELEAIKDIVLEPNRYRAMRREGGTDSNTDVTLKVTESVEDEHIHYITLEKGELEWLQADPERILRNRWTSDENSHNHNVMLKWRPPTGEKEGKVYIHKCDFQDDCWDGHGKDLENEDPSTF